MHEFSLCTAIIDQVARANKMNLSNVEEIILEIGELSCVDIESLSFWFAVVSKNAKGGQPIKLAIQAVSGQAKCNKCMGLFHLITLYEPCPKCKECGNYTIISGQELLIKSYVRT
jgi:hydrogenase nickel incorporation protein HypA/HybF